jgi:glutamate formiminotransferase / 5-formyltetrahydrofolate cyclo-ligase
VCNGGPVLECVVNISEGRRGATVAAIAAAAGPALLDVHADPYHHRAVLTVAGLDDLETAVRSVARSAVESLDLGGHLGAHPRLGVVDVVPFVDLSWPDSIGPLAVAARDRFAAWAGDALALPCFCYGPGHPTLPEVRRRAWSGLQPDRGPQVPHPTAGATAVGARSLLVAYNLWLAHGDLDVARAVAGSLRGPHLRALGLDVGGRVQVSCNLLDPMRFGPGQIYDAVASRVEVGRAELVGLLPHAVLNAVPRGRWRELDLDPSRTIEARLEEAGLGG